MFHCILGKSPNFYKVGENMQENPQGITYYVDACTGSDTNDGLSPETAFYSLKAISALTLHAGDRVLLRRGCVFENQYLHLKNVNGQPEQLVVIDAYGEGALPRIDTNGCGIWFQDYGCKLDHPLHRYRGYVSSCILLYDCSYVEVQNIALTNGAIELDSSYHDIDRMNRTGVAVVAQNAGTLCHIYLKGLDIRHVHGNVYDKHMNNGGIYFTAFQPLDEERTGVSRFDDILVENCYLEDVNRWGIAAAYTAYHTFFADKEIPDEVAARYGSSRVVIRGNYVKDAGGDAITPMYCDRPLVERNISQGAGRQMNLKDYSESQLGRVAAAVWPWKCKNALLQYNEVFETRYHNGENQDGQAFDADWGDGTVYQYNYSHDNEGGCLMVCGEEAVNTVFRYNISQNDGRAVLLPASSPVAEIYNNTFFVREDVPFIATNSDEIGPMILKNNIIYRDSSAEKNENWYLDRMTYENNIFFGYSNPPIEKGANLKGDPGMVSPGTGKTGAFGHPALDSLNGYRLKADALAIGKGLDNDMSDVTEDFFGTPLSFVKSVGAHQPQEAEKTD